MTLRLDRFYFFEYGDLWTTGIEPAGTIQNIPLINYNIVSAKVANLLVSTTTEYDPTFAGVREHSNDRPWSGGQDYRLSPDANDDGLPSFFLGRPHDTNDASSLITVENLTHLTEWYNLLNAIALTRGQIDITWRDNANRQRRSAFSGVRLDQSHSRGPLPARISVTLTGNITGGSLTAFHRQTVVKLDPMATIQLHSSVRPIVTQGIGKIIDIEIIRGYEDYIDPDTGRYNLGSPGGDAVTIETHNDLTDVKRIKIDGQNRYIRRITNVDQHLYHVTIGATI